ncbi:MAG: type II toxin-antitoxin system HicB family antitoxin [Oscillospiraceae bacterium]|nr:type II toxin-antitoxin system HicB family antitoxin [Oscillospiraceae bacterium]
MGKLTKDEFLKRVEATPIADPDEWDLEMLSSIAKETDHSTVTLDEMKARRECSGKLSVRIPKDLHHTLIENAKQNGVSLNQFILYKLAK